MRVTIDKIYRIYLYLMICCAVVILICAPLQIIPPKVLAYYFHLQITMAMVIIYFMMNFRKLWPQDICFLLMALSGVLSLAYAGFTPENMEKVTSFLVLPMLCLAGSRAGDVSGIRKLIFGLTVFLTLFYIGISLTPIVYETYHDIYIFPDGQRMVSLGYYNPNEAAMYLGYCILMLLYMQGECRIKLVRALLIAGALYLLLLLRGTGSRTVEAMLLAAAAFYLIYRFKSIRRFDLIIIFCIPVIYVLAALSAGAIQDLMIEGESIFTGREDMYAEVFHEMDPLRFFVGDFQKYQFQNLHNGYMAVFATVGALGLAVTIAFLFCILWEQGRRIADLRKSERGKVWLYCSLAALLLNLTTEAQLVTFGGMVAVGFAGFYILLQSDRNKETHQKSSRIRFTWGRRYIG